tara:strand:- start:2856 stop:3917 length:1062 start_codon:yes stop_codon:yes gene_type:complete
MPQQSPEFMRAEYLTGIVRTTDVNRNYIGSRWFPRRDSASDEFLTFIQLAENPLAPFVSVDSETPIIPGDIWGQLKGSIAFMRYKARFGERDLRLFTEAPLYQSGNNVLTQLRDEAEAKIMQKVEQLSQSIDAREEWMAINAMLGAVTYDSGTNGNVQFDVTFPGNFIGTKRQTASPLWDGASPTPVQDLINWIGAMDDVANVEPSVMVCSNKVLRELAKDSEIRELWGAQTPTGVTPSAIGPRQVAGALSMIGISEVIAYNAKYTTRTEATGGGVTRTVTRFLADNKILLLPDEPLGYMWTAPAEANDWNTGKFAWTKDHVDPWVVEVGAGLYAFPDMQNNMHHVLEATVGA